MRTDVDTALKDIADWFVRNRQDITEPELKSILLKHCESDAEVRKFVSFLETEPGQLRFKIHLRERKGESPSFESMPSYLEETATDLRGVYTVPGWPEVKGIFVGGCVERGIGSSFRAKAHAHCHTTAKYFGWICVRSIKRVGETQGNTVIKPSHLLWHEYAHILTPNHYHDDAWRRKMGELGQPIKKQYEKKERPR